MVLNILINSNITNSFLFFNFIADAPIYKVNSAPQRFREGTSGSDPWAWDPQVPQAPVRRPWGFRALGVNYYYMSYFYILSILIIATILN